VQKAGSRSSSPRVHCLSNDSCQVQQQCQGLVLVQWLVGSSNGQLHQQDSSRSQQQQGCSRRLPPQQLAVQAKAALEHSRRARGLSQQQQGCNRPPCSLRHQSGRSPLECAVQ
jgi:hypothetical protein